MRIRLVPIAAAIGILFAGFGWSRSNVGGDPSSHATRSFAAAPAVAASPRGPKLRLIGSDYGRILADGQGRALYLFTADHAKRSACSGDCATAWPPYVVKSTPAAVYGAKPGQVGTIRRSDGKLQATYAGRPVYYYVGDRSPGEVNCQAAVEFGGYWYVLRRNGRAVR